MEQLGHLATSIQRFLIVYIVSMHIFNLGCVYSSLFVLNDVLQSGLKGAIEQLVGLVSIGCVCSFVCPLYCQCQRESVLHVVTQEQCSPALC